MTHVQLVTKSRTVLASQAEINQLHRILFKLLNARQSLNTIDELPMETQMKLVAQSRIAINFIGNITEEMMRLHDLKWVL